MHLVKVLPVLLESVRMEFIASKKENRKVRFLAKKKKNHHL